jgi:hypothetical protein
MTAHSAVTRENHGILNRLECRISLSSEDYLPQFLPRVPCRSRFGLSRTTSVATKAHNGARSSPPGLSGNLNRDLSEIFHLYQTIGELPSAAQKATQEYFLVDTLTGCLVLCQSLKLGFTDMKLGSTVIPAQAGIQTAALDSRLRGNDVTQKRRFGKALGMIRNVKRYFQYATETLGIIACSSMNFHRGMLRCGNAGGGVADVQTKEKGPVGICIPRDLSFSAFDQ